MSRNIYNSDIINFLKNNSNKLSDNDDVNINNPQTDDILIFNNNKWENTNQNVKSFNSRTGDVLPTDQDYDIDMLRNVEITNAQTDDILVYNAGIASWENKPQSVPLQQFLNDLGDVNVGTEQNGQPLVYNSVSTKWENQDFFLNSLKDVDVNTAVAPQTIKYEPDGFWRPSNFIQQINNIGAGVGLSSVTDGIASLKTINAGDNISIDETSNLISINADATFNSGNTILTTPQNTQNLQFNGTNWVNVNNYNYKNVLFYDGATVNPIEYDTIYCASNSTLTLPAPTLSDIGKRILISCANSSNVTITIPSNTFINTETNFIMISSFGSVELIVSSATQYQFISVYGNWSNVTQSKKVYQKKNLIDLEDTLISNPVQYDKLIFDGTKWVNKPGLLWDDVTVPVTSTTASGSKKPTFDRVIGDGSGPGSQGVFTYWFSASQEQELYFTLQLPHTYAEGTNVRPHFHFVLNTTTASGTIKFGLEYSWSNVDETFPNTTFVYGTYNVTQNQQYKHLVQGFTDSITEINGTGKKISSMICGRVFRDVTNDTFADVVGLLEIDFHILNNTDGSEQEYIK